MKYDNNKNDVILAHLCACEIGNFLSETDSSNSCNTQTQYSMII